jgi:hypothetical protein
MTRAALSLLLAAGSLSAAVIRGTVVENYTGKLLAHAVVILKPMENTPTEERTVRTDRFGGFEFDRLPAGVYVLKASRRGFISAEYGQKRWNSAGQPIVLEESATTFLHLRLPRFGAVSGTVVDENDIGLPNHDVSVYRAARPPELVSQGKTDDRGQYRVGGLVPGRYVVRTGGGQYDDGSYLPTFSRETPRYDQSQIADVMLELETGHIDVRPLPGRTYSMTVSVDTSLPGIPVTITVASDMGRKTVEATENTFSGLAPGDYEVYAEAAPPLQGAYQRLNVRGNETVSLICDPAIPISVTGDSDSKGQFWVRRKDFAGVGPVSVIPVKGAALTPGRWEVLLRPSPGNYVSGVFGAAVARRDHPEGWVELTMRKGAGASFRVSGGDGGLRGTVKDTPYALVYLEGYDSLTKQRIGELWTARADAQGRYRFEGLAPGPYRLVSTFEYLSPDTETMDLMTPVGVQIPVHGTVTKDLDLWGIR